MLKGSKRMRYSGIVEMVNSVAVLLYTLYWYYSCTTSQAENGGAARHSTLIFIVVMAYQLYKLGASWYASKAAFYSKNARSMVINGGVLTGLSLVWLYFAGSNLNGSFISVIFVVTAGIDVVCSHLFVLSALDNREKANAVTRFRKRVY